jgi:DNA (cytosine-5)-methyltransferase 1
MRPKLLDLFCGAGGCAVGYHRAGFDVVGIDRESQPRYPYEFIKADAFMFLRSMMEDCPEDNGGYSIHDFSVIHASPPCQGYSRMRHLPWLKGKKYPLLIAETVKRLEQTGKTWVVENVEDAGAEVRGAIMLCGTMFDLKVYRHRLFLSNRFLWQPPHRKHKVIIGKGRMLNDRAKSNDDGWVSLPSKGTPLNGLRPSGDRHAVAGHFSGMEAAKKAMGIDWMNRAELSQAIPPAYTEFIGKQLLSIVEP